MEDSSNYGTEFNITYQTYKSDGFSAEDKIILKIGKNLLAESKAIVSLTKIYTRWNSICYKINTTRKANLRKTDIKLKAVGIKYLYSTSFFFTSEENSYGVTSEYSTQFGVTNTQFEDGKIFATQLFGGEWKEMYLSVAKHIKLACRKESFFEYVASELSESNFQNCNDTCLRTSLPNERYQICPYYEDWYENLMKENLTEMEEDCNWGIVRDLMKDTTMDNDRQKTCTTTDYYGKIMTEKANEEYNELGIQYSFAFPLRAKMYQEYFITDMNELVGSAGGMLGLFIGFSFSNIVTCIIGHIETLVVSRNKLSEWVWASIGWIFYMTLLATSIWFAWGVLDKFSKQDTGIQSYEEEVETHPTIVICMGSFKYDNDFYITYVIAGKDGTNLKIGYNYLEKMNETVTLTSIHTRYNGQCYAINTTNNDDERHTVIQIFSQGDNLPASIPVIFTSEINSYGITQRDWRDGEGFSFFTSAGNTKFLELTVEKSIKLKCSDQSFYEYVASRLSEENFENCNDACLMTSLPNDPLPICPNYDKWYAKDTIGKESNCNWLALRDLIQNITINEEHLKTCMTTQYLGKITIDQDQDPDSIKATFAYKFLSPLKTKVYEEYLITDGITLIGSVGGTLGLFIGFSISNVIYSIVNFLQSNFRY